MDMNRGGVWQADKERHDGSSFPVQNGWHRNGTTPASVSLLRGPNRGEWPEVVAGSASIERTPCRHASVKKPLSPTATCDSAAAAPANTSAPPDSLLSAKRILRDQRLRDLLAAVEEYRRASGPDRTYWRRDARHRLAEWRRLYAIPERAAFQAAVANSLKSQMHIPLHKGASP